MRHLAAPLRMLKPQSVLTSSRPVRAYSSLLRRLRLYSPARFFSKNSVTCFIKTVRAAASDTPCPLPGNGILSLVQQAVDQRQRVRKVYVVVARSVRDQQLSL